MPINLLPLNPYDFGAYGDDAHDDTQAIQAMFDAVPFRYDSKASDFSGAMIQFPPGIFRCSKTIHVSRPCVVQGAGTATKLYFTQRHTFLWVHSKFDSPQNPNWFYDPAVNYHTWGATNTQIRGLSILLTLDKDLVTEYYENDLDKYLLKRQDPDNLNSYRIMPLKGIKDSNDRRRTKDPIPDSDPTAKAVNVDRYRKPNTTYKLGDRRRLPWEFELDVNEQITGKVNGGGFEKHLICTRAGTSSSDPYLMNKNEKLALDNFRLGPVAYPYGKDETTDTKTEYETGECVKPSMPNGPKINGRQTYYVYRAQIGGKISQEPDWNEINKGKGKQDGSVTWCLVRYDSIVSDPLQDLTSTDVGCTIQDGTCEWTVTCSPGILLSTKAHLSDVQIHGATDSGIHVEATTYDVLWPSNANSWWINHCQSHANYGHGLYVKGEDANIGSAIGLDCSANGGHGIKDHSFLACTFVGCHVGGDYGLAAYYRSVVGAPDSTLFGCYCEGSHVPDFWYGSAYGGMLARENKSGGSKFGVISTSTNFRKDGHHSVFINRPDNAGGAFGLQLDNSYDCYDYTHSGDNDNERRAKGWWAWSDRYDTRTPRGLPSINFAMSTNRSNEGVGLTWNASGEFRGVAKNSNADFNPQNYKGYIKDEFFADHIRFGRRIVGDRWPYKGKRITSSSSTISRSDYLERGDYQEAIVTRNGMVGGKTRLLNYQYDNKENRLGQDIWDEGRGYVHGALIEVNGYVFQCTKAGTSSGLANSALNWTYSDTVLESFEVVHSWLPGVHFPLGTLVRPLNPNGEIYEVHEISKSFGITSAPLCPLNPNNVGTDGLIHDGDIVWIKKSYADHQTYVVDGTVHWTCVGPSPKLSPVGRVAEAGSVTTNSNQVVVVDTYPLPAEQTTLIRVWVTAYTTERSVRGAAKPAGAVFELTGAWLNDGNTCIEVMPCAPSAKIGLTAALTLNLTNAGKPIVECKVTGYLKAEVKWNAIRLESPQNGLDSASLLEAMRH